MYMYGVRLHMGMSVWSSQVWGGGYGGRVRMGWGYRGMCIYGVWLFWQMCIYGVGDIGVCTYGLVLGAPLCVRVWLGRVRGYVYGGGQCNAAPALHRSAVTASRCPPGPVPAGDGGRVRRGRPRRQHGPRPHRPGGQRDGHHPLEPDAGHAEEARLHVAPAPAKLGCWRGEPGAAPASRTPTPALPRGRRAEGALPGRRFGREPPRGGVCSRAGAKRGFAALELPPRLGRSITLLPKYSEDGATPGLRLSPAGSPSHALGAANALPREEPSLRMDQNRHRPPQNAARPSAARPSIPRARASRVLPGGPPKSAVPSNMDLESSRGGGGFLWKAVFG